MEYTHLFKSESHGKYGSFGIRIEIGGEFGHLLDRREVHMAARDAEKAIEAALMTARIADDPKAQKRADNERAELLACFPFPIFVEEIPNGYCSQYCCRHLPWFIVTTSVGRFTIGWRKRVINLDWEQTRGTAMAEDLFPDDNTTKGDRYIHAWSTEDAARYVKAVIESADKP